MMCTLFTGQPVRRVFLCTIQYEHKKKCVELYREGKWPETPHGIQVRYFHNTIRKWVRAEDAMDDYIRYYNNERIQARTNWMPPVKYRKASSSCVYFINILCVQDSGYIS